MKAKRYETSGVHLGWALSMMGGMLIMDAHGVIEWHLFLSGHLSTRVREFLEMKPLATQN